MAEGDKRTTRISRAETAINIQMITWSSKHRKGKKGGSFATRMRSRQTDVTNGTYGKCVNCTVSVGH